MLKAKHLYVFFSHKKMVFVSDGLSVFVLFWLIYFTKGRDGKGNSKSVN